MTATFENYPGKGKKYSPWSTVSIRPPSESKTLSVKVPDGWVFGGFTNSPIFTWIKTKD